ncbi:Activating signal cointegrator 1 complex subunit 3 [Zancudomyces culisetae]|uniref:Activating signal cointegrator 1 complex subunit 3 n=1 Tax=Zancudomyces culisetae TaxID=1213189 RepID=A0A1R1PPT5_ZANCU|nr:Activating signal cointegrator 1 complex subunit 3 [Zancudomyces culisetae]|eukprot:OMH82892.1 Activating signal cointegrator 1 complex subunit 3 [Zancudomyces culisetae]
MDKNGFCCVWIITENIKKQVIKKVKKRRKTKIKRTGTRTRTKMARLNAEKRRSIVERLLLEAASFDSRSAVTGITSSKYEASGIATGKSGKMDELNSIKPDTLPDLDNDNDNDNDNEFVLAREIINIQRLESELLSFGKILGPEGAEKKEEEEEGEEIDQVDWLEWFKEICRDINIQGLDNNQVFQRIANLLTSTKTSNGNGGGSERVDTHELENALVDTVGFDYLEQVGEILRNLDRVVKAITKPADEDVHSGSQDGVSGASGVVPITKESGKLLKARREQQLQTAKTGGDQGLLKKRNVGGLGSGMGVLELSRKEREELHIYTSETVGNKLSDFGGKISLPVGTKVEKFEEYEQITIPMVRKPGENVNSGDKDNKTGDRLVKISDMDELCKGTFLGYKTLNFVQSRVYDTLYNTNENILVCAPTGAGKTDVGMLGILREIKQSMGSSGGAGDAGADFGNFLVVYIAPMKALASEIVEKYSKKLKWIGGKQRIKVYELTGDVQLTRHEMATANVIVTTPEKWDVLTRKIGDNKGSSSSSGGGGKKGDREKGKGMTEMGAGSDVVNKRDGDIMGKIVYEKVMEQLEQGYQAMIFVHSRKETVTEAMDFKGRAIKEGRHELLKNTSSSSKQTKKEAGEVTRNKELVQLMEYGIGIHHAGMVRSDRKMVERREALNWLQYTFMHVRMRKSPMVYGINPYKLLQGSQYRDQERENKDTSYNYGGGGVGNMIADRQREIVRAGLKVMDELQMVSFDSSQEDTIEGGDVSAVGMVRIKELGKIAADYYIKYPTIDKYNSGLRDNMTEADVLVLLSSSTEFDQIVVRESENDELLELKRLGCVCQLPMGKKVKEKVTERGSGGGSGSGGNENERGGTKSGLSVDFEWNDAILGNAATKFWLFLEQTDPNNGSATRIIHVEQIIISKDKAQYPVKLSITLPLPFSLSDEGISGGGKKVLYLRTMNDRYINTTTVLELNLSRYMDLAKSIPKNNQVVTNLLDATPLMVHPELFMHLPQADDTKNNNDSNENNNGDNNNIHTNNADRLAVLLRENATRYHNYFSRKFKYFNPIQSQVFHSVYYATSENVLVGAPTGSGKTVIAELAIFGSFNKTDILMAQNVTRDKRKKAKKRLVVYIAPLKALVKERVEDWQGKMKRQLNKTVLEFTGEATSVNTEGQDKKQGEREGEGEGEREKEEDETTHQLLERADLVVTTPEKWDAVSRLWNSSNEYVKRIDLLIIDEIHMLGTELRGPVLEVLVSRMVRINPAVRIVGLSTAVSNAGDFGSWLGIRPQHIYNFNHSVRPVPAKLYIEGFDGVHYCPRMAAMNKPAFRALLRHSNRKPAIVFVSSKRQTRLTAMDMISFVLNQSYGDGSTPTQFINCDVEELARIVRAAKIQDSNLAFTLGFGIGLHHAGLNVSDRQLVEELFRTKKILLLVSTSTLAWGINMPAHMVVVKGTEFFNPLIGRDKNSRNYVQLALYCLSLLVTEWTLIVPIRHNEDVLNRQLNFGDASGYGVGGIIKYPVSIPMLETAQKILSPSFSKTLSQSQSQSQQNNNVNQTSVDGSGGGGEGGESETLGFMPLTMTSAFKVYVLLQLVLEPLSDCKDFGTFNRITTSECK